MGAQGVEGVDAVEVRRAGVEDAAMMALVGGATFLDGFAEVLPGEAIVAHAARHHVAAVYAAYLARSEVAGWLAVVETGAAVGYALLTPPELPEVAAAVGDMELKRIYLLSRFHGAGAAGQGVAQRMMEAAVAEARVRGARRLLLGVHAGNARALRFYARNGFRQVGTRQFQVGPMLCDDFVMGREL